jgi:hypothetical protein
MNTFQTHPISFLPTFSAMLHELINQTKIQYKNLCEAKTKPQVLDDQLIERLRKVYREQQEQEKFWIHQLEAWQKQTVDSKQKQKIQELIKPAQHLKSMNQQMLTLIDELAPHTLTKILQKDSIELALDFMSIPIPFGSDANAMEKEATETSDKMKEMRDEYLKTRALFGTYIPQTLSKITRGDFQAAAQKLKMYENGSILSQSNQESFVLLDYCLFQTIKNGKNLIQQIFETHITTLIDEEKSVYGLLKNAFFAVLRVDAVLIEGGIAVFDLIKEEYFLLFDQNFAQSAQPGMLLVCHLVKQSNFVLTTGASIPVTPRQETHKKILNALKTFFVLYGKKDQRALTKLATELYKLCIWDNVVLAVKGYES